MKHKNWREKWAVPFGSNVNNQQYFAFIITQFDIIFLGILQDKNIYAPQLRV